jgi:hypothetical protein
MQIETETRTSGAAETVKVTMNYLDWLQEFREHKTCTYTGEGEGRA